MTGCCAIHYSQRGAALKFYVRRHVIVQPLAKRREKEASQDDGRREEEELDYCELRFRGESLFGISMGILVKWLWLCSHVLRGQRGRDRECDKYSLSLSERSNNCCHAFSMMGVMVVYC